VVNDDNQNPSFNIWDLRSPEYPVATFPDIHYNGILSVGWCLKDSNLLVSSAKDYKTIVTNFKTGEPMLEFPTEHQY
jgi:protein transport protein SEC31